MARYFLFGATGQVGRSLLELGQQYDVEWVVPDRQVCDLTVPGAVTAALGAEKTLDGVINAAAYTKVDLAETDIDAARAINTSAPGEIASACADRGLPLLHYSTDYVFDGRGSAPLSEKADTGPLGVYGQTKLEGEQRVQNARSMHAIVRLSWVFSPFGSNFVKTMLRLGAERSSLRIVDDQIGKPTSADGAAKAGLLLMKLMRAGTVPGTVHYAGDTQTSWAGFARKIFEFANLHVRVEPITTSEYPTPAERPLYSVLDTSRFEALTGEKPCNWNDDLRTVIGRIQAE